MHLAMDAVIYYMLLYICYYIYFHIFSQLAPLCPGGRGVGVWYICYIFCYITLYYIIVLLFKVTETTWNVLFYTDGVSFWNKKKSLFANKGMSFFWKIVILDIMKQYHLVRAEKYILYINYISFLCLRTWAKISIVALLCI